MRYFETRKARIEIVPMIDIMFFLLVFFVMITLRMIPATGVASQLPQSGTAEQMPPPSVIVTLQQDGGVIVEDLPITLEELTRRLSVGEAAKKAVTIAGAASASVQQLMSVIDACRRAGVKQIGLAATKAER
ncbi:biopolymer transporter ExbD [Methylosinus sp. Sm6]|uniref:ExbD/TolR family protein n=1 Tax=Methylosinus sp. Sm6 TaxID=2866948 RepID=UPI001C99128C|nr:biopolymer transporter ExbD [Methylosinus sp. Sm6]MBY6239689.1 biopolymer transporter ExbD [Methylosinus sp. Sm6]